MNTTRSMHWAAVSGMVLSLAGLLSLTGFMGGCEKKVEAPSAAPAKPTGAAASTGATAAPAPAPATPAASGPAPSFSLAWSEYPSWSVFGVASDRGLIDGAKGKLGPIEKKYNVDIELKQADYDPCLQMYGSGATDAVCITNMDALNPALSRKSVLILPTSTSNGGDALIAVGVTDIKQLRRPKAVFGLAKSVSEYAFVRALQVKGEDPAQYDFRNMDPGAAAQAMQTRQKDIEAIMVWNPFVLQTLNVRPDAKVIVDSSVIPGEIIDAVVIARESLSKPGGDRFAKALIESYYEVCKMMADPKTADATFVALGAKFSSLDAAQMRKVCTQTLFYDTPAKGVEVVQGEAIKATMNKVVDFCIKAEIVPKKPLIAYGPFGTHADADLTFDPTFMEAVAKQK